MTPADEARALLEAATPGEWRWHEQYGSNELLAGDDTIVFAEPCGEINSSVLVEEHNAALIAAAPRLLRALLEERERLREALRDLADPEMQYIGPMDAHVRVDMARRALKGEP